MSKGRFEKEKKRFPIWKLVLIVLAILIFLAIILWVGKQPEANQNAPKVTTEPTIEKNPNSIAVPGYEMLELKADSKEQSLCFPNPPQNVCYFQITLCLEDGTQLWVSELIEPGTNSKPMVLAKALPKGTYPNAVLRYSCYRMDEDLSPLNGAETKVTLWVK